ncbi:UDP-N-acetylglucosamine 2-epimerase [Arthrobacter sp. TMS1-12-1]
MKVLAFVGTRADLFPFMPVLQELAGRPGIELSVCSAVGFADGAAAVLADGGLAPDQYRLHDLGLFLADSGTAAQTALGARLSGEFASLLQAEEPDAVVVLGDRWELMYIVPPTVLQGCRLVHLHGGEVTEGALDERVRHAVTKLADQHCVSTAGAERRVAQLGESSDRIHRTGAPGLDRFSAVEPLSADGFSEAFGVELARPLIVATYHPPTAEQGQPVGELARQVFEEVTRAAGTAILTYPGFDSGREEIISELLALAAGSTDGTVVVRESLGSLYPGVMATADALVGNSSSGILEAASFGLPVVNVGARQQGREHAGNVIDCPEERGSIRLSIERALSAEFRRTASLVVNPYGDGHSAARIADVVAGAGSVPLTKVFVDQPVKDTQ